MYMLPLVDPRGGAGALPLTSPADPGNCKKWLDLSSKLFSFQLDGDDLPLKPST